MSRDRNARGYGDTSGNQGYESSEERARRQAYEEYLKLRENSSSRGNYVKDDTLYGSYFTGGGKSSSHGTPYGESEMRRKTQEAQAREQERQLYMDERDKVRKKAAVARQGRKNKDDKDKLSRSEMKAAGNADAAAVSGGKKKKRKKKGRGLKVALIVVIALILGATAVLATGFVVIRNTLANVGHIDIDQTQIAIDPTVDEELSNYRNIALLGIDARDMDEIEGDIRSDAIIVASVNKETGEIKMFSVYRDTMLNLGDNVGLDKVTHAYYYGGAQGVLYALNKNLDLNIHEVVVVNWKAVADTVDALGGIDVEIQESEINEMNKFILNTYKHIGGSDELITEPGMQTLNGNQAVTYARIRKDAVTGDYRRNERMKIVVKATFDKAKQMDIDAIKTISNDILPQIKTNMTSEDMMFMALDLASYSMTDSEGFPYDKRDWSGNAFYTIPVTLNSNVTKLHEQFFGQDGYQPTETVQGISNSISGQTGYY